mgnify:FL=1
MAISYKLDGKPVDKKDIPADAKLTWTIHEEQYETEAYRKQQAINASKYFREQSEIRADMEKYHG